jgi:hypothetical protein
MRFLVTGAPGLVGSHPRPLVDDVPAIWATA